MDASSYCELLEPKVKRIGRRIESENTDPARRSIGLYVVDGGECTVALLGGRAACRSVGNWSSGSCRCGHMWSTYRRLLHYQRTRDLQTNRQHNCALWR